MVTRGYDDPEALAQAGVSSGAKHALFLDFEAEGASLVLRARITTLDQSLRIVSAHGNWPWVTEILHVAFRRPNLFLAPDYLMANMPGMSDYISAADSFLADQFLFASAFPFAPVVDYTRWFRGLPISPANLEKVMGGTAQRLLGLSSPQ